MKSSTSFKPGQPRPANAGRKKGTPNKKTVAFQQLLEKHNFDPGEELIYVYNETKSLYKMHRKKKSYQSALDALENMQTTADKICQFVYPKKKAIEHTGEVNVKTFADFVAAAENDLELDSDDDESQPQISG